MTTEELKTARELIYALQDILHCMVAHPEKTARDIAGDIARLAGAAAERVPALRKHAPESMLLASV